MKKTFLFILMLSIFTSYSQKLKLSSSIGYAIVEGTNFKKNALSTQFLIGREFILKEFVYLDVMVGITKLKYSSEANNASFYNTNSFVTVPIMLRKYYPLSKKTFLFGELGPAFNYEYRSKIEVYVNNVYSKSINSNLGFTVSLNAAFGIRTVLGRNSFFEVGIYNATDMATSYSKKENKLKADRKMLSLVLHMKLGK